MKWHRFTRPVVVEVRDEARSAGCPDRACDDRLLALVYELLDAHFDTVALARPLETDQEWAVHLDYLRGLQRAGREALARVGVVAA
jgi:hypothetical protein